MKTLILSILLTITLSWDIDDICPSDMPANCPNVIQQTCGWREDGSVGTFNNPCFACKDRSILWWDWGTCSSLHLSSAEIARRTKLALSSRNGSLVNPGPDSSTNTLATGNLMLGGGSSGAASSSTSRGRQIKRIIMVRRHV
jgi:hypothetical protein